MWLARPGRKKSETFFETKWGWLRLTGCQHVRLKQIFRLLLLCRRFGVTKKAMGGPIRGIRAALFFSEKTESFFQRNWRLGVLLGASASF